MRLDALHLQALERAYLHGHAFAGAARVLRGADHCRAVAELAARGLLTRGRPHRLTSRGRAEYLKALKVQELRGIDQLELTFNKAA